MKGWLIMSLERFISEMVKNCQKWLEDEVCFVEIKVITNNPNCPAFLFKAEEVTKDAYRINCEFAGSYAQKNPDAKFYQEVKFSTEA